MHFLSGFVLAALPLLAAASPISQQPRTKIGLNRRFVLVNADGSVDADALRRQLSIAIRKIQTGISAFQNNTGSSLNSANTTTNAKRNVGQDPLIDAGGQLWFGQISVGSPPATFTVDFDTGSSDLFLPGPQCTQNCNGHTIYDPSASSSSQDLGQTFVLQYGDGSTVNGEQFSDTVSIAGLTAQSQTLGVATQYSSGFDSSAFAPDGLMGMAFQSISVYNAVPVFQSLVNQGQTSDPVFAFKLAQSGSELSIGGTDSSLFSGGITFAPVTQQGYWQVNLDSVTVGGNAAVSGLSSIIDTGTTLIIGDAARVSQFYQAIPGSNPAPAIGNGFFTVPCGSVPTAGLTFNGNTFNISPDTFNLGTISAGSSDCVGGIVSADIGADFWIVGDVFLQNVYSVFDFGNSQVGFAQLA